MCALSSSSRVGNLLQKVRAVILGEPKSGILLTWLEAYFPRSLSGRLATAACRNFPQLRLSRPGTCSRALRIALSENAFATQPKIGCPLHGGSQSAPG